MEVFKENNHIFPAIIEFLNVTLGTVHLRSLQILTIFDPYPPTIGIPTKYL